MFSRFGKLLCQTFPHLNRSKLDVSRAARVAYVFKSLPRFKRVAVALCERTIICAEWLFKLANPTVRCLLLLAYCSLFAQRHHRRHLVNCSGKTKRCRREIWHSARRLRELETERQNRPLEVLRTLRRVLNRGVILSRVAADLTSLRRRSLTDDTCRCRCEGRRFVSIIVCRCISSNAARIRHTITNSG